MNELLREIEDDIRREKFDRLWQHFGKIMVGVSVAVVLATVAVVVVQNHKQSVAMEQTGQFIKGLDRLELKDYKGAVAAFSPLSDDVNSTYYGIAMLRKAQAQEKSGNRDGEAKTYQALAAHGGVFGALAEMRTGADKTIAPDKQSPFYYAQSEWNGWQLMKAGMKNDAIAQFTVLRDDADAPFSLRQRLQEVVSAMNDDSMHDKSIKKDEQKK